MMACPRLQAMTRGLGVTLASSGWTPRLRSFLVSTTLPASTASTNAFMPLPSERRGVGTGVKLRCVLAK